MEYTNPQFRGAGYGLFMEGNKVLMLLRKNTTWFDNYYSLPAGRLNKNEYASVGTMREVAEEVGVKVKPEDLEFVHCAERHDQHEDGSVDTYFDIFFHIKKWEGELRNNELDKCERMEWLDINNLPDNVIPFIKRVLEQVSNNIFYSETQDE
jgi:8-oxo-dGTP diphosphatase